MAFRHCLLSAAAAAKSNQSCPTLCEPIDGSPPGSSVHRIFQARVLEWGAIACCLGLQKYSQSPWWRCSHSQILIYLVTTEDQALWWVRKTGEKISVIVPIHKRLTK